MSNLNEKATTLEKGNKGIILILFVFLVAMALALIPTFNTNVSNGMAAVNAAASTVDGTILDSLKYGSSMNILAMLLIGFGFLMVFVRGHGFSSITATFIVVSVAIPFYMLIKSYGSGDFTMETVSIDTFIFAEFAAASLLITIGAPLGRLKMEQYFFLGILFIPAYILNEWLMMESGYFEGFLDTGGSIVIHAFGAYFGLGVVSNTISKFKNDPVVQVDKNSNQFCLLGSMMLWIFWPSFTSALVAPDRVVLTVINTVFALCAATLATFLFSKLIRGKIEIEDIANAALAGGVAIGSTCDVATPGLALLIGLCAGALSTVGYALIAPKVEKLIRGTDTCGINNLHGMPGILGGLSAIIITQNAGIQIAGILVTVVIAFVCGKIAGLVVGLLGKKETPYSDVDEFILDHESNEIA
jgi:ammonium transporter Rh